MNAKWLIGIGITALVCVASVPDVLADDDHHAQTAGTGLVREVKRATRDFLDVNNAGSGGYESLGSCVSGPEKGAMGVHFGNGPLIMDGQLDAQHPELLIYEFKGNRARLVGVEFLVIAEAWHTNNTNPPVLMGQHFHYVGAPNRYGLPPFYELHVWAWKENRNGTFVDWNPEVTCDGFVPE
jgi:hypothetical protein